MLQIMIRRSSTQIQGMVVDVAKKIKNVNFFSEKVKLPIELLKIDKIIHV